MMNVYHGSYAIIDRIDLSYCKTKRDFGQGFYVTKIRSQAEYWAIRKGKWRNTKGFVTEFGLNEELVRILKLKVMRFEGYTDEWLDFTVLNRNNMSDKQAHDYDMVEGPIADDDVAPRIRDYIREEISKEHLLTELTYKSPTHQICFCTEHSLQVLITQRDKIDGIFAHTDNEIVQSLITDCGLTEQEAMDIYYTSKTYTSLADENTELYLKPWREIYLMLLSDINTYGSTLS
jgi:hypothetical protein